MGTESDAFFLPEVGNWTLTKHENFAYYCSMFSSSMKNKWDCRVYLDLFAGAGRARIKDTDDVIDGSPIIALDMRDPFDYYVFCEQNPTCRDALISRTRHYCDQRIVKVIPGDCNQKVSEILQALPRFDRGRKGLTFCLVDPYKMSEVRFSTLQAISKSIFVDFLVLIPSYMDIHRNEKAYTDKACNVVDLFLGNSEWREKWRSRASVSTQFGLFIAREFCSSMASIGFHQLNDEDLVLVKNKYDKNQPLYHLGFFSKSKLGLKFWRETKLNTSDQLSLF